MNANASMAQPLSSVAALSERNAFIDHIRVLLTILVVLHHTAIAHGGSGGWYWREVANASNTPLVMFNAFNQSFFMGFFFLLAGYFTTPALRRKGPRQFIRDRIVRLGVPLLLYCFLLHPLTIAIARTTRGFDFLPSLRTMIMEAEFAPGPLWFAEALLLFSGLYLAWNLLRPTAGRTPFSMPSFRLLLLAAALLGISSFVVRLWIPVGQEFLWLQLGYFPCYVALFILGCAAWDNALLEKVTLKQAGPWLALTMVGLLVLFYLVQYRQDQGSFDGGWNLNALMYALWDPLTGFGVILALLLVANMYFGSSTPALAWLARNAYGAFIVHPPIVVTIGVLAAGWDGPPLVKFVAIGLMATVASFLAGGLLRQLPGLRRVL